MNAEDPNQGLCESFKLLAQSINATSVALVRVRFQTPEEFTVSDELAVVKGRSGWVFLNLHLEHKYRFRPPEPSWFCTLQDGNSFGGPAELLSDTWQPWVRRFSLAAFLLFPIRVDRIVWGILSIGSADPAYDWDALQQGPVKLYCHALGNMLVRRRGEEKLKEQRDFLRQAQLKIGEAQQFQKAILSTLPDIKMRVNSDGVIVDYYPSVNDALPDFTSVKKPVGKNLSELVPLPVASGILNNVNSAIASREVRYFEFALPARKKYIYYEARFSAINDKEVIMVLRNISERIKAQEILQEKLRELDEKNRQLRAYIDSNMQLENFAYIASHDIREPLRTMRTFAQLLENRYQDLLDEDGRDYVKFIAGAAKNMNQLIEDLLIYSRVEFGENEVELVDMDQLLEDILQSLKEIIESRQAQVTWGHLPHMIKGNVSRLKQLFQNLIINAIKFGPPGGIPVVHIQCKSVNHFCQFSITDNGIGISNEFYDKIFLIFKKLHGKGQYEGTGIGLALCKKIVEQHGGKIWVESTPGAGSTFYFTLPH